VTGRSSASTSTSTRARPRRSRLTGTIEAVKAHLSMGEITGALRDVFGSYTETPVF
jgi:methylmalonyl-CoA mutase N-terminal domain/subunit